MIKVYTDGGVSMKNGVGGWAAVLVYEDGSRKGICGAYEGTDVTNNKMEMEAIRQALRYIAFHHENEDTELISDSEYIVNGVNSWSKKWILKDWKCTTGPVKNKEIWIDILGLVELTKAKLSWVRGHNGDENNEIADRLAVSSYKELIDEHK